MTAVCRVRRSTVAQRQAARHRVGIGIVVRQDQHAIRVVHVALILLDALARDRAAELGEERRSGQLGQRDRRDFRESRRGAFRLS